MRLKEAKAKYYVPWEGTTGSTQHAPRIVGSRQSEERHSCDNMDDQVGRRRRRVCYDADQELVRDPLHSFHANALLLTELFEVACREV